MFVPYSVSTELPVKKSGVTIYLYFHFDLVAHKPQKSIKQRKLFRWKHEKSPTVNCTKSANSFSFEENVFFARFLIRLRCIVCVQ